MARRPPAPTSGEEEVAALETAAAARRRPAVRVAVRAAAASMVWRDCLRIGGRGGEKGGGVGR